MCKSWLSKLQSPFLSCICYLSPKIIWKNVFDRDPIFKVNYVIIEVKSIYVRKNDNACSFFYINSTMAKPNTSEMDILCTVSLKDTQMRKNIIFEQTPGVPKLSKPLEFSYFFYILRVLSVGYISTCKITLNESFS